MIRKQIRRSMRMPVTRAWVGLQRIAAGFVPMPKPTLLIGPGSSLELCDRIAQLDFKRILLVTDKDLARLDLFGPMRERLESHSIEVVVFDGIRPDPATDQIDAGVEIYRREDCDGILAVGGGSVLDAAKLISVVLTNDRPLLDMKGFFRVRNAGAPLFVVPTTHGTGSEATIAAVVSDPVTHSKTAIMDLKLVPQMAALDPELLTGLPRGTSIHTAVDAMTHAIESFMSVNANEMSERLSVSVIRAVEMHLPRILDDPSDLESRLELLVAAFHGGEAFTQTNVGYIHAVAHRFGGFYGVPHGLANAIVLPHVLDLMVDRSTERLAELARRTGKARPTDSDAAAARAFQQWVASFLRDLDIPQTLDKLRREDLTAIAEEALEEAHEVIHYAVPFYLKRGEIEQLVARMLPV